MKNNMNGRESLNKWYLYLLMFRSGYELNVILGFTDSPFAHHCLKKNVTNGGLETCNEKASRQRCGRLGAVGQYSWCGAHSRTEMQVKAGKSAGGEWKRSVFVLDGATCDPKTQTLLSKCRVLCVPSVWPGLLQSMTGITIILPARSTEFSQKHTGKAAFLEDLPFTSSLSKRATLWGMETPRPSCPPSPQGCRMESCSFQSKYSNRWATRLSRNPSCASLCKVAAVSSSKERKQRNFFLHSFCISAIWLGPATGTSGHTPAFPFYLSQHVRKGHNFTSCVTLDILHMLFTFWSSVTNNL